MAGRRPQDPPPIESKRFTLDEIESGIRKLNRRLNEVKSLDPKTTRYDDERLNGASRNIKADLLEIFGRNSPEYRAHGAHDVRHSRTVISLSRGSADPEFQRHFAEGWPKTIAMLEGLVKRLEEKRDDLEVDKTDSVRSAFERLDLHQRIAEVSVDLYRDRHYRNAVLDSCLALEDYVKQKSRCRDRDGVDLMRLVFSRNNPVLAFSALTDDSEKSEQEGMMHLFEGVMLALRNPRAHALLDDSPEIALEYIAFISLLAKRVDQTRRRT